MREKNVPYLCGGTFFLLLLRAKTEGKSRKERLIESGTRGAIDNNNQTDVMGGLIKIFYPTFYKTSDGNGFARDTSEFRRCKKSYSVNLPMDNKEEITAFTDRIKTDYGQELLKMHNFITNRLESDSEPKMLRLTKSILTLIMEDQTLGDDEIFYALENGEPVTKKELLKENSYCIDSLLLGTWHYILTHRNLDNEKGDATFAAWCKLEGCKGNRWNFTSNIGLAYPKDISVHFVSVGKDTQKTESMQSTSDSQQVKQDNSEKNKGEEPDSEDQSERIEGEIVNDTPNEEDDDNTTGKNVFINVGSGPQIGQVGTFNYYPGNDK